MATRRQFLKRSAIGGTAMALLPGLAGAQTSATPTTVTQLQSWLRSVGTTRPAERIASSPDDDRPAFRVLLGSQEQRQLAHEKIYDHFDLAVVRLGNIMELHASGDCIVVHLT